MHRHIRRKRERGHGGFDPSFCLLVARLGYWTPLSFLFLIPEPAMYSSVSEELGSAYPCVTPP